jgi:hypothetical protein
MGWYPWGTGFSTGVGEGSGVGVSVGRGVDVGGIGVGEGSGVGEGGTGVSVGEGKGVDVGGGWAGFPQLASTHKAITTNTSVRSRYGKWVNICLSFALDDVTQQHKKRKEGKYA